MKPSTFFLSAILLALCIYLYISSILYIQGELEPLYKLDDKVEITGGFFEGKTGRVVDKPALSIYTIDIGEREIQVSPEEMKK